MGNNRTGMLNESRPIPVKFLCRCQATTRWLAGWRLLGIIILRNSGARGS